MGRSIRERRIASAIVLRNEKKVTKSDTNVRNIIAVYNHFIEAKFEFKKCKTSATM